MSNRLTVTTPCFWMTFLAVFHDSHTSAVVGVATAKNGYRSSSTLLHMTRVDGNYPLRQFKLFLLKRQKAAIDSRRRTKRVTLKYRKAHLRVAGNGKHHTLAHNKPTQAEEPGMQLSLHTYSKKKRHRCIQNGKGYPNVAHGQLRGALRRRWRICHADLLHEMRRLPAWLQW